MKNQRGQGAIAVEVVLLAPLLMVFLFLIFEFGRVFGSWLIITNAGREGARYLITQNCDTFDVDPIAAQIRSRVQQTAQFLAVNSNPCTGTYDSCIDVVRETPVGFEVLGTVTARYRVYTLMPITGNIPYLGSIGYPGYLEVVGRSTMRCE